MLSIKKASYVLFCLLWCSLLPAECPPLNDAKTQEIISYAAKLWQIGEASQLNLISNGTLGTTCYRNLTLDGGSIKHPMTLILSPDQRFISGWLIDLTRTPEDAQRDEMDRMKRLLTRDVSPHKGDPSSPVTIVEFADFECPYCKAFDHSFSSLPENMRQAVNLVFKHLPLANHPWAREVAGAAACAGLQSDRAFWLVHDFVFKEQETFTSSTALERVSKFASNLPDLNVKEFNGCVTNHGADSVIRRDESLARTLLINRTPTIFINGVKAEAVHSSQDLELIIRRAVGNKNEEKQRSTENGAAVVEQLY